MNTENQTSNLFQPIFPQHHHYYEELRKYNITKQDVKKTKLLFKDFHIKLPQDFQQIISQFTYYYELENWRRHYIVQQLSIMERNQDITE